MSAPLELQAFSEDNPATVDKVNHYFSSIIAAVNALAGEPILQWTTAAPSSGVYMPVGGGDFTGPITVGGNPVVTMGPGGLVELEALTVDGADVVTTAGGQSIAGTTTVDALDAVSATVQTLAAEGATVGGADVVTVAGGQSIAGTTTVDALAAATVTVGGRDVAIVGYDNGVGSQVMAYWSGATNPGNALPGNALYDRNGDQPFSGFWRILGGFPTDGLTNVGYGIHGDFCGLLEKVSDA